MTETEKSPEQLYQERERRITDAIQLKVPDRVPFVLALGYFPAKYGGITCQDAYYDARKWRAARRQAIIDLEPDAQRGGTAPTSGLALEALDPKEIKWPGHGVSPNHSHQMLEPEAMREDEYDDFLTDPGDFILRKYLPRTWGAMAPFEKLPPLRSFLGGTALASISGQLASPELAKALAALAKAAAAQAKWQSESSGFDDEMSRLGFPSYHTITAASPFDFMADNLRGMHGVMVDMYRRPEKLIEACEKQSPIIIERVSASAKRTKNKRVWMALHRGGAGFMSPKQFETFYWPTLKRIILAMVDMGLTPVPHFNGDYNDKRLEHLLELPKGKVLCHFSQTDASRAQAVLGGHNCIKIGVPSSALQVGSVQEVEEYCKKLIDTCGKHGGFIMTQLTIDEAKPENVKAMIEFTKRYGVYR